MSHSGQTIVVGAGIIGASIAWHLAKAGRPVTVLAGQSGGIATPASFSWINASWGNPRPYFDLRIRAMAEWERLAADLPGLAWRRTGALCFDLDAEDLASWRREHESWGYRLDPLDRAAIAALEPALANPPDHALHAPAEGFAEPVDCVRRMLADAAARGARIIEGVTVDRLVATGGRVSGVETAEDRHVAGTVVLAAGLDTARLAATIGVDVPMSAPPGLIVHSRPTHARLNGLVIGPELHMRQTLDGRIIAGSDFGGSQPGDDPDGTATALFAKVQAALTGGSELVLDRYTIGYRPTPTDGVSIIGRVADHDGLYLAVTHSGVTLAPALGLFAAREIAGEADEPLLAPFRLSRFG